MPEPEPGRPPLPQPADARGLRAGGEPAHAHRQGTPAAGHRPPAQRGLLPPGGAHAVPEQAAQTAALPRRDRVPGGAGAQRPAALPGGLRPPQEVAAAAAAEDEQGGLEVD